ncbi:MAG: hypothetical protein ACD_29C00177G0001 [uncultured bacterium]|nr:MAG: hypothetical protein ACD_29C00177G0001 [uncultured bacterium]
MRFYNHRISSSKSRSGVSSSNRKCQRKITCTKNNDRAYWNIHASQIGFWHWLTIRISEIDGSIYPRTLFNQTRKHQQLINGTFFFTLNSGFWQSCFIRDSCNKIIAKRCHFIGNTTNKCADFFRRFLTINFKCCCGEC